MKERPDPGDSLFDFYTLEGDFICGTFGDCLLEALGELREECPNLPKVVAVYRNGQHSTKRFPISLPWIEEEHHVAEC
jgi:hypothetical protein